MGGNGNEREVRLQRCPAPRTAEHASSQTTPSHTTRQPGPHLGEQAVLEEGLGGVGHVGGHVRPQLNDAAVLAREVLAHDCTPGRRGGAGLVEGWEAGECRQGGLKARGLRGCAMPPSRCTPTLAAHPPAQELSHQKSLALHTRPRASHASRQLWCCAGVRGGSGQGHVSDDAECVHLACRIHSSSPGPRRSHLLARHGRHAGRGRQLVLQWQQRAEAAIGHQEAGATAGRGGGVGEGRWHGEGGRCRGAAARDGRGCANLCSSRH